MKIKRKAPKAPRAKRPLYIVGYTSPVPRPAELQAWFELTYGAPLRSEPGPHKEPAPPAIRLTHGPWSAVVRVDVGAPEREEWAAALSWRHTAAADVAPAGGSPADLHDTVLHAARLARGLTLLTDGTAYDLATGAYLNPSDWQDRPLSGFHFTDHVLVQSGDSDRPGFDWLHTLGLSKFGRDELEFFQPTGLPEQPACDRLLAVAEETLRLGPQRKVGETLRLELLGLSLSILRHRTIPILGTAVAVREVAWTDLA